MATAGPVAAAIASGRGAVRTPPGARCRPLATAALALLALTLAACGDDEGADTLEPVDYVDLDRFMGDWYVVAGIVTAFEQNAYNPVETYERVGPEKIATTFTFNKGGFDGKQKTMTPKGFVRDTQSNAVWGMQFIWPFKMDYRVIYLNDDYTTTVIGRNKRDYVWIMSRTPTIADAEYEKILQLLDSVGYDTSEIERMPHEATAAESAQEAR